MLVRDREGEVLLPWSLQKVPTPQLPQVQTSGLMSCENKCVVLNHAVSGDVLHQPKESNVYF